MVRHIVAFRLSAEDLEQRAADAEQIQGKLQALRAVIEDIAELHVGIDPGLVEGHWDVVLVSDFADHEALERYQAHPEHVRVAQEISVLMADRAVVDYELTD